MISEYREGITREINNILDKVDKILTEIELSVNDTIAVLKGVDEGSSPEDMLEAIKKTLAELDELSVKLY